MEVAMFGGNARWIMATRNCPTAPGTRGRRRLLADDAGFNARR
jgi:hypothetical protein